MSFSKSLHLLNEDKHAKLHTDDVIPTYKVRKSLGIEISIEYLLSIGIKPVFSTKTGAFWRREDIPSIARAIAADMFRIIEDSEQ